jgi:hypothetical protein
MQQVKTVGCSRPRGGRTLRGQGASGPFSHPCWNEEDALVQNLSVLVVSSISRNGSIGELTAGAVGRSSRSHLVAVRI